VHEPADDQTMQVANLIRIAADTGTPVSRLIPYALARSALRIPA